MTPENLNGALSSLYADERKSLYLVVSGAGTRLVSWLFQQPGASRTILGVEIPYSRQAFDAFLGYRAEQYVSLDTAQRLAEVAYEKACELSEPASVRQPVGISCTGKLRSPGTKSADRVFCAFFDGTGGVSYALPLGEIETSRDTEEMAASALLLNTIMRAVGLAERVRLPLEYERHISEAPFAGAGQTD